MLAEGPIRGVRDHVLALRSLDGTFSALDDDALSLVAEHARRRTFRQGEVLTPEGQPIRAVYVILRGWVRVTREGKQVADVQRGRGVGFLNLLSDEPTTSLAVALEPVVALEVPVEAIHDAMENSFSWMRNSLRLSSRAIVKKRGNLPRDIVGEDDVELGTWRSHRRGIVERLLDLRQGGIFAESNLDSILELARRMKEVRCPAGTVLFRLGDPSSFNIRIDYGKVRCTAADGQTTFVGGGFVLGGLDALAAQPRSYQAVTVTDFVGERLDTEDFLVVMENYHHLARSLLRVFSTTLLKGQ